MGEVRTTKGESLPLSSEQKRSKRTRFVIGMLLFLAIVGVGGQVIRLNRWVTAGGTVTSDKYAEIRTTETGVVGEILAHTGDVVEEGALLIRLDTSEIDAEAKEAESRIAKSQADLERLELEFSEKQRELDEARAKARFQHEHAAAKLARTQELLARGLVAGSVLEDDTLRVNLAKAEMDSLLARSLEPVRRQIEVAKRELVTSQDALARVAARRKAREIHAPTASAEQADSAPTRYRVLRYQFVTGQRVTPDQVLMELFGGDKMILKARVPEVNATKVKVGQTYRSRLTTYGGLQRIWFRGTVEYLRDAIQAEGTATYRMAYCTFDPQGMNVPPGTTAKVEINTGKVSLWSLLLGLE